MIFRVRDDGANRSDVNFPSRPTESCPLASLPSTPAANEAVDPLRVWFRFIRLHRRAMNTVATELKTLGLSIPQFDLLSTLTEQEGLSQQELAQRLYVTKGNVSGLLDRMVEAGLVERRAIPGDRRSNALHLTPKGRDLAERGIAVQKSYVEGTLGGLPPQDLADLERIVLAWRERAREAEEETLGKLQG